MGEVVQLGEVVPEGWLYVPRWNDAGDESWYERPVGGGLALAVMCRDGGYEALVPGVEPYTFFDLSAACAWAERTYCGCVVRR